LPWLVKSKFIFLKIALSTVFCKSMGRGFNLIREDLCGVFFCLVNLDISEKSDD